MRDHIIVNIGSTKISKWVTIPVVILCPYFAVRIIFLNFEQEKRQLAPGRF